MTQSQTDGHSVLMDEIVDLNILQILWVDFELKQIIY